MTTAGWIIMIVSVVSVLTLAVFCVYRVLTLPPVEVEHLRGTADIDPGDADNAD